MSKQHIYLVHSYVQSDSKDECQGHPLGVSTNLRRILTHFELVVADRIGRGARMAWDVARADHQPFSMDAREALLIGPQAGYTEHVVLQCWPPRRLTAAQVGNPPGLVGSAAVTSNDYAQMGPRRYHLLLEGAGTAAEVGADRAKLKAASWMYDTLRDLEKAQRQVAHGERDHIPPGLWERAQQAVLMVDNSHE